MVRRLPEVLPHGVRRKRSLAENLPRTFILDAQNIVYRLHFSLIQMPGRARGQNRLIESSVSRGPAPTPRSISRSEQFDVK